MSGVPARALTVARAPAGVTAFCVRCFTSVRPAGCPGSCIPLPVGASLPIAAGGAQPAVRLVRMPAAMLDDLVSEGDAMTVGELDGFVTGLLVVPSLAAVGLVAGGVGIGGRTASRSRGRTSVDA